jgi:Uma2 family endonuclease
MAQPGPTDTRLSAEAFLRWSAAQPEGRRYELVDGIAYEMAAEQLVHARAKAKILLMFQREIDQRRLPCEALGDGMAVRIDADTVFEPDALVRCGADLPGETVLLTDPSIVVEVASPSTQRVDALWKFSRYFHNPSLVHYLIVMAWHRSLIHHRRTPDGRIESVAYESGVVTLDPPGLELDLAELFAGVPAPD